MIRGSVLVLLTLGLPGRYGDGDNSGGGRGVDKEYTLSPEQCWLRCRLAPDILGRWHHLGFLVFKIGLMPSAVYTSRLFREFFKKLAVVKTPVTYAFASQLESAGSQTAWPCGSAVCWSFPPWPVGCRVRRETQRGPPPSVRRRRHRWARGWHGGKVPFFPGAAGMTLAVKGGERVEPVRGSKAGRT